MRYALCDEQQMLQQAVGDWLQNLVTPEARRGWFEGDDLTTFPRRFAEDGWAGIGFPEDEGGQGGGLLEQVLVAEQVGRFGVAAAAWEATVAVLPILDEVADHRRAAVADGSRYGLLADASRDLGTAAVLALDGGTVSGEVRHVLAGDVLDVLLVPVRTSAGTGIGLVETHGPGVTRQPTRTLDRGRSFADVALRSAPITVLDGVHGDAALTGAGARLALLVAAGTVGACDAMLTMTVEYTKQREQFGGPIASFQAVKHAAAQMLVAIEPVRSVVYYAAWSQSGRQPDSLLHVATAKAQAARTGLEVAESALRLHGAVGFTWEHDLQFFYKRVKLDQYLGGAARSWNDRIADLLELAG